MVPVIFRVFYETLPIKALIDGKISEFGLTLLGLKAHM